MVEQVKRHSAHTAPREGGQLGHSQHPLGWGPRQTGGGVTIDQLGSVARVLCRGMCGAAAQADRSVLCHELRAWLF
jgi:hypothetical protein